MSDFEGYNDIFLSIIEPFDGNAQYRQFSDIGEYIRLLRSKDYDGALLVLNQYHIIDYRDMLAAKTIQNDPDDNPSMIERLVEMGFSICQGKWEAMHHCKPKTMRYLLKLRQADNGLLGRAIRCGWRDFAVMFIENGMEIPDEGKSYVIALSHAKRAAFALLKSHALLGKDITRIIAKLVWGSRANINWEK